MTQLAESDLALLAECDDYPTDAVLKRIAEWDALKDACGCLEFVAEAWHWPDFVKYQLTPAEREVVLADDGDEFLRLATGGWSGNESLISAMFENTLLRAFTWRLSSRGGLHIFEFPRCQQVDSPASSAQKE